MDFEPMDVDKSASSASKMDISFDDTDPDLCSLENDDICKSTPIDIITKKEIPEDDYISSHCIKNRNVIKHEKSENMETQSIPSELFDDQSEKLHKSITKPKEKDRFSQFSATKTYHIKKHQPKKKTNLKLVILFIGVLVLLFSMVIYQVMNINCVEEIDLGSLRKSFYENLFGQSYASDKIIESLNMDDKSKIIFLYGGTGVGKTFAVSLVMDKIWDSANVYHYTMPTFTDTFSPELMFGLTICKTSYLVVDDLTRNDMHVISHIRSVIAKSENLGKNITVFLVYNCDDVTENFVKKCDNSFQKDLEQSFNSIDVEKYFIQFQPLQQEHLRKCIEREMGGRKVSAHVMNNILKNFDVSLDGCKGVYMKIKSLNVI